MGTAKDCHNADKNTTNGSRQWSTSMFWCHTPPKLQLSPSPLLLIKTPMMNLGDSETSNSTLTAQRNAPISTQSATIKESSSSSAESPETPSSLNSLRPSSHSRYPLKERLRSSKPQTLIFKPSKSPRTTSVLQKTNNSSWLQAQDYSSRHRATLEEQEYDTL